MVSDDRNANSQDISRGERVAWRMISLQRKLPYMAWFSGTTKKRGIPANSLADVGQCSRLIPVAALTSTVARQWESSLQRKV